MKTMRRRLYGVGVMSVVVALLGAWGCSEDAKTVDLAQPDAQTQSTSDAASTPDGTTPGDATVDAPQADAGGDAATSAVYAVGFAHMNGMDTRVASVTFDPQGNILGYAAPTDGLLRLDAAAAEPFTDSFVHAVRFTDGEIRSIVGDASLDDTYPANAGEHLGVVRVNATTLPASGQATYTMVHATRPSRPLGAGIGIGDVVSGQLQVSFGGATGTRAGLTMNLAFDAGTTQIVGNGGGTTPGDAGGARFLGDGGTWLVEVPGTATATGTVCGGGACVNAFAYVLFAGANAERAIVVYQFRDNVGSSAPGFKPSGVAVFAKE